MECEGEMAANTMGELGQITHRSSLIYSTVVVRVCVSLSNVVNIKSTFI